MEQSYRPRFDWCPSPLTCVVCSSIDSKRWRSWTEAASGLRVTTVWACKPRQSSEFVTYFGVFQSIQTVCWMFDEGWQSNTVSNLTNWFFDNNHTSLKLPQIFHSDIFWGLKLYSIHASLIHSHNIDTVQFWHGLKFFLTIYTVWFLICFEGLPSTYTIQAQEQS